MRHLHTLLLCLCFLSVAGQGPARPMRAIIPVHSDTFTLHYYIAPDSGRMALPEGFRWPAYVLEGRYFRAASEILGHLGRNAELQQEHIGLMEASRQIYQLEIDELQRTIDMLVGRHMMSMREIESMRQEWHRTDLQLRECLARPIPKARGWLLPAALGATAGIAAGVWLGARR